MRIPPGGNCHAGIALRFLGFLGWGALLAAVLIFNSQKQGMRAELERLQESQRKAAEQTTSAKVQRAGGTATDEVEKLKREAEDVHKLRNEVRQLRDSQKEMEQLRAENQQLRTTAQQAQKMEQENAQLRAVNQQFEQQRTTAITISAQNSCIANLKQLDGATQQWALENRKTAETFVVVTEIARYLKGGKLPVCPQGGTYSFRTVAENPQCSIPGHRLQ